MLKNKQLIGLVLVAGLAVVFLAVLDSAKGPRLSSKLSHFVQSQCTLEQECLVDLKNLTEFEWDEMYYVSEGTILDHEEALSLDEKRLTVVDHGIADHQIVFLNDGIVVYSERLKAGIEGPLKNEIIFEYHNRESIRRYPSEDSVFLVERIDTNNGGYFGNDEYFLNLYKKEINGNTSN